MNEEKVLKLDARDFRQTESYYKEYCGKEDVMNFDGSIEIASDLGVVRFNCHLRATKNIVALSGTGIKADGSIVAGMDVIAGWGVKSNDNIKAGGRIEAGAGIEAGENIVACTSIEAGESIEAYSSIVAGESIEAGGGIVAGLSITSKSSIKWFFRMFAGTCHWRNISDREKTITCSKLEPQDGAIVGHGIVVETGATNQTDKEELLAEINKLKEKINNL